MQFNTSKGFVIYKLPNSKTINFRIGNWTNYTNQKSGFLIQSFDNSDSLILNTSIQTIQNQNILIELPLTKQTAEELSKNEYLIQLNNFIKSCSANLKKVISSRIINKKIEGSFDIYQAFKKLTSKHENALVYILNIPNKGMWMGATPETLLKNNKSTSYTVALAGSQNKERFMPWENKEVQEHKFVIEDITNKLQSNGINYSLNETSTVFAGEVAHLKTIINIESSIINLKKLADILHPTSAVCGMPQKKAYDFIIENESYDREFYTGYLGELDVEQSWLFVNLRCMQVYNDKLCLYVGGGITKDSLAEKEWEETELKSQTLLSVIEKI